MKKSVAILTAVLMAALFAVYLVTITSAGPVAQPDDAAGNRPKGGEALDLPVLNADDLENPRPFALELQQEGDIQVMIQLEGIPSAEAYAAALPQGESAQAITSAQAQLAQVEAAQQALLPALEQLDATVLYRTQRVYNGIAVMVDASKVLDIRRLSGVKDVRPLEQHEVEHRSSVPLIGAPAVWDAANLDATGEGISIGIIDTGIDYLHANFGGNGAISPTLYATNDTTVVGDIPGYPSVKVAGGYDFVGDNYDGSGNSGSPIPNPDPDPMDCHGHGSHVAGTAAGYGVLENGETYTGTYGTDTDFESFRIAPGVAPEATLYALRVFGCGGSTGVTTQAIEWAVDPNGDGDFSDHLDVINMSLGSSYGSVESSSAVASNNAAAVGVLVVASAGNSRDVYYVTGSPAIAERALSVAASVDATSILDGFRVNNGSLEGVHPALKGVAFDWTGFTAVTGTLSYPATQPTGCEPFNQANKNIISGTIVLLNWTDGECPSSRRGNHVEDAGAIGFLLADNSEIFDLFISGSDEMPSYSIPEEVGDALIAELETETISVTLSTEYDASIIYETPEFTDAAAYFTSRGPRRDSLLKPDITAPGMTIFSTDAGTGSEGTSSNGTSMAAPHVSGVMALLRELHPYWSTEELKALAMNTALHSVRTGDLDSPEVGPGRIGAGRVNAQTAASSNVVAYNAGRPGAVSVSFGEVEVLDTTTINRTVHVSNKGSNPVTYLLSYEPLADIPGVEYTLSTDMITVNPHSVVEVTVTMNADASQMKHTHDPSIETDVDGVLRNWISEEAGYLRLMPEELQFATTLSGAEEVPPVDSEHEGSAIFTYNPATGDLDYDLDATIPANEVTGIHIHKALPGVNGGVIYGLYAPPLEGIGYPYAPGTVTISDEHLNDILDGSTYVNIHTNDNPSGELRGQIMLVGAVPLQVPLYTTARPVSDMEAEQSSIDLDASTVISLTGQGLNTGTDYPTDTLSLVSALELQIVSSNEDFSEGKANNADIAYVGVTSDMGAVSAVSETLISFGIATHGEWSTPNEVGFDIYIDTNQDGETDYVLFSYNLGPFGYHPDTYYSVLLDLSEDADDLYIPQHYLNGISPALNTHLNNTNVMVLPVFAEYLGLTEENSTFDYFIVSWSVDDYGLPVEVTSPMTYDAANPGIDFNGGMPGTPVWEDLDGEVIPAAGNFLSYLANDSQGVLLLHHHNAEGDRVEIVDVNVAQLYMPFITKH